LAGGAEELDVEAPEAPDPEACGDFTPGDPAGVFPEEA